ncbi:MAG: exo-alpha-sialidase [Methanobacteriota archaeon]
MSRPLLASLLLAPLLVAGCIGSGEDLTPSAGRSGVSIPASVTPFSQLLCSGDLLVDLSAAHDADCNFKATDGNGPAAEVFLVANPTDPLNLVGGSKDFTLGEDERCGKYNVWSGVYVSRDGGRTWKHSLLPGHPGDTRKTALSDWACGSDPVLAFSSDGILYYASIHITLGTENREPHPLLGPVWGGDAESASLAVTRSRDGGATWEESAILAKLDDGNIIDKEWIAVDPVDGTVYVTYIDISDGGLKVQRSFDQGRTWTEPVVIVPNRDGEPAYIHQFGQVAVGTGGVVHYIHFVAGTSEQGSKLHHYASSDRGETWDGPTVVAPFFLPLLDLGVMHKYRVVGMPALAADPASDRVVVIYPARDPADAAILAAVSDDAGATWAPPVRVNDDRIAPPADQGLPTNDQWMTTAAIGPDGTIHTTWIDYRDDPRGQWAFIYYSYSTDGGKTWAPNVRVSDAPFDGTGGYHQSGSGTIGDYMGLAVSPLAVTPFWADTREGRNDVWSAIIPAGPGSAVSSG